jgi:hypothetical protein
MWSFKGAGRRARGWRTWAFGIVIATLSLLDLVAWASLWNPPNAVSNVLMGAASPFVSPANSTAFASAERAQRAAR